MEWNGRGRGALVAALVDAGVRVVRVDADRDVEMVRREVQAHFQVSWFLSPLTIWAGDVTSDENRYEFVVDF